MTSVEVRPLDSSRRADFMAVHAAEHDLGWCRCVAWWTKTWEGFGDRTEGENLALREGLFARGVHDGYVAYADGRPVGWCQVGPRDRWPKLCEELGLEADPETVGITCFAIVPTWRRRGIATRTLAAVLEDLARRGVRRVEAYPRREASTEPGELWTGPERMYERAGFERVGLGEKRLVMARTLSA